MLNKLKQLVRGADAPTEDDSPRGGAFSYAGETHAFLLGVGAGVAAAVANYPEVAAAVIVVALGGTSVDWATNLLRGRGVISEIRREPWYAIGGVLAGHGLASVGQLVATAAV